jgi:hypothetical protein
VSAPVTASSEIVWEGMTETEAWTTVDQTFPLSGPAWADVMKITPDAKRNQAIVDMIILGGLGWTKRPSGVETLMAGLTFLANVANPVSAIAGGATSLATLAAALKAL